MFISICAVGVDVGASCDCVIIVNDFERFGGDGLLEDDDDNEDSLW